MFLKLIGNTQFYCCAYPIKSKALLFIVKFYSIICLLFFLSCRRAFVTPRILQQQIKENSTKYEEEDDDDDEEIDRENKHKADMFIENPADVRERFEQRRQDQRRGFGGRSRAAFPRSDVVGMSLFIVSKIILFIQLNNILLDLS